MRCLRTSNEIDTLRNRNLHYFDVILEKRTVFIFASNAVKYFGEELDFGTRCNKNRRRLKVLDGIDGLCQYTPMMVTDPLIPRLCSFDCFLRSIGTQFTAAVLLSGLIL